MIGAETLPGELNALSMICPIDQGPLTSAETELTCQKCGMVFPTVDGIPILIDDENSVFARADYQSIGGYIGVNFVAEARGLRRFYHRFARALQDSYNVFPPMAGCGDGF